MVKQRLQRFLAGVALCAVLTGALTVPAAAAGFQDVPKNHWAAESIQRCVTLGFFHGETADRFGLGHPMTRSAFTVVLCRFFGWETPVAVRSAYRDVPTDAWYAGAVEAAYAHGAITDQREDFRPADAITREELAVMLVRALGYGTLSGLVQDLPLPFQDVTTNAGYIRMAYDMGLMSGTTATRFSPDQTATREQVAVIFMRLYERLQRKAPDQVAVVAAPADLSGLTAVVVPGGRLRASRWQPSMQEAETAAIREAAQNAGAKTLLGVTGLAAVLDGNGAEQAAALAEAVADGGYDGLYLEIPQLGEQRLAAMTGLSETLRAALGEKLLYLAVEAPTRNGKPYAGYDYAALGAVADRLALRVSGYQKEQKELMVAPMEPLEEVYYALAALKDTVDASKLSLSVTTTPSAWNSGGQKVLSAEEFAQILADPATERHYSEHYACAYAIYQSAYQKSGTVWYFDEQAVRARVQLARIFGVDQFFLTDWTMTNDEMKAGLR